MTKFLLCKTILFSFVAMTAYCLIGCNNNDDVSKEGRLELDKSVLNFESTSGSDFVEILDAKEWDVLGFWGVEHVYCIDVATGKESFIPNTFVVENNEKGDSFNVYANPVIGEWYSIVNDGSKITVNLDENNGAERKLIIQINAASNGQGYFTVIQKGK